MLEGVGELLEEAVGGGLAVLLPDLGKRHIKMIIFSTYRPRCPVAVFLGDGPADCDLGSIILGRLLSADKLRSFLASHVVDNDVLVLAELVLDVAVLDDGTELNIVFLLYIVEVDLLETADHLVDVEAGHRVVGHPLVAVRTTERGVIKSKHTTSPSVTHLYVSSKLDVGEYLGGVV
jgi:hypothetical protein